MAQGWLKDGSRLAQVRFQIVERVSCVLIVFVISWLQAD
jgi:hypothetical protein